MNTTWEVADVHKPLISASRLLERGHKLVLDEKPRIQCKNGDTTPLEWTGSLFAVRLWIPKGFSQAGLNTNRIKKRKPVRPHTEGRTRNAHAVWPVTDACDRADESMDEPADPDGHGEEVTDTVGMTRVLAAPRTAAKAEREEHDVTHVPYRLWCRFCVMGRGLESGDRDGDRARVFADYGYLSGDSTPLLIAKDRRTGMTFAAPVPMKGGGDPHAARLLAKWIDGLGCREVTVRTDGEPSICELIRRVRELRAEAMTTVDEVSPPGDSAERPGGLVRDDESSCLGKRAGV